MKRLDKIEIIKDIMDDLHHGVSVTLHEVEYDMLVDSLPSCVSVAIGRVSWEYKLFINN